MKKLLIAIMLGLLGMGVVACDSNDDFGDRIEEASDDIGDQIEDAGDEVEDAADEVKDEVDG